MHALMAVTGHRPHPAGEAGQRVGSGPLRVREMGHGTAGGDTSSTWVTSSPRPAMRCMSPERAATSGSSARRVVVSGPAVTLQSSNCAHSVLSAWPIKVISYPRDGTRIIPHSWWLTLAVSVPGGGVRVVTRFRVIRGCRDNRGRAAPATGTGAVRRPAPAAELPGPLPALHCSGTLAGQILLAGDHARPPDDGCPVGSPS